MQLSGATSARQAQGPELRGLGEGPKRYDWLRPQAVRRGQGGPAFLLSLPSPRQQAPRHCVASPLSPEVLQAVSSSRGHQRNLWVPTAGRGRAKQPVPTPQSGPASASPNPCPPTHTPRPHWGPPHRGPCPWPAAYLFPGGGSPQTRPSQPPPQAGNAEPQRHRGGWRRVTQAEVVGHG